MSNHLETLQKYVEGYFSPEQVTKETWLRSPCLINIDNIRNKIFTKDDLVDIRSKKIVCAEFHTKDHDDSWCSLNQAYPLLVKRASLIPFATTYL